MSNRFEGLYLNVINTLTNPLFIKDDRHNWIFMNDAFCILLGLKREELIDKSDYEFFPKEQADVFWEKDNEVLKTGKSNINEEELTTKEGGEFTLLTSKTRIQDNAGNNYILGVITDITEMKFDEIQLEKKHIQIKAQKNEIESLVRQAHHQSEQNLSIINSLIDSLLDKISEDQNIEMIEDLSNWIKSMIGLHQFFNQTVNLSSINVQEYLQELANDILKEGIFKVNLKIKCEPAQLEMRTVFPLGLIINDLLLTCQKFCNRQQKDMVAKINLVFEGSDIIITYSSDEKFMHSLREDKLGLIEMIQILLKQIEGNLQKVNDSKLIMTLKDVKTVKKSYY